MSASIGVSLQKKRSLNYNKLCDLYEIFLGLKSYITESINRAINR